MTAPRTSADQPFGIEARANSAVHSMEVAVVLGKAVASMSCATLTDISSCKRTYAICRFAGRKSPLGIWDEKS